MYYLLAQSLRTLSQAWSTRVVGGGWNLRGLRERQAHAAHIAAHHAAFNEGRAPKSVFGFYCLAWPGLAWSGLVWSGLV